MARSRRLVHRTDRCALVDLVAELPADASWDIDLTTD
jgi:hypothetical protein